MHGAPAKDYITLPLMLLVRHVDSVNGAASASTRLGDTGNRTFRSA